jgi:MFS family permease
LIIQKGNYRIGLFSAVTLLFWFSMYTCVPILSAYVKFLGSSNKMAGLIIGMYGLSQMILRIPVGVFSDRIHKRKMFIIFGLFFSILAGLGILVSHNLSWILFLRALAGAAAATWVDFTILFTSYYLKQETTKAIGTLSFFSTSGQMLGILCGGWFADAYGWDSSFIVGAVVGLIGFIFAFFIVENFDANEPKITFQGVMSVTGDRMLLTVSFLSILFQMLTFATVFGFTPIYTLSLGASKSDMGLLTFLSTFPTAIASWFGGSFISRKLGEKNIVIIGFVLIGIFTSIIPFTRHISILLLSQAIAAFGRGFVSPILMSLSIKQMDVGKRATAMGFYQAIYGLGMFLGPIVMGIIGDLLTLKEGFIILGLLGCVTSLLAFLMIKIENPTYFGQREKDITSN